MGKLSHVKNRFGICRNRHGKAPSLAVGRQTLVGAPLQSAFNSKKHLDRSKTSITCVTDLCQENIGSIQYICYKDL